jgi:phosphatidate phosphatase APP1
MAGKNLRTKLEKLNSNNASANPTANIVFHGNNKFAALDPQPQATALLSTTAILSTAATITIQPTLQFVDRRRLPRGKDIVINYSGIFQNLQRNCPQRHSNRGAIVVANPQDFNMGDISGDIRRISKEAEIVFWSKNSVQIDMDVRDTSKLAKVLSIMDLVRTGFYKGVRHVRVNIIVPRPSPGSLNTEAGTTIDGEGNPIYPPHNVTTDTVAYKFVKKVVQYINGIGSLKTMSVVLDNEWPSQITTRTISNGNGPR